LRRCLNVILLGLGWCCAMSGVSDQAWGRWQAALQVACMIHPTF
jgi:hypothetical protein